MKKIILITTLVALSGCATSGEFEHLLFQEDALLLAKLERPIKSDINPKDDQYPAETLSRQVLRCRHGIAVSSRFCRIYHCPVPPRKR